MKLQHSLIVTLLTSTTAATASSLRGGKRQVFEKYQELQQHHEQRKLQTSSTDTDSTVPPGPQTPTEYDPVPVSDVSIDAVPDFWTSTATEFIGGVQTGSGMTYNVNFQNIQVSLINSLLMDTCESLNAADSSSTEYGLIGNPDDPNNIYDQPWVEWILSEPKCMQSCVNNADTFFGELTGLQTNTTLNTVSYGDIADETTIQNVINSFQGRSDGFTVANETVRQCIMNYEQFECDGCDPNGLYDAAKNANMSTLQFAPGLVDSCELQLGSAGAFYDETTNSVTSLCNPDSPGVQYNDFMLNGKFSELFTYCGYEFPAGLPGEGTPSYNPYYDFMLAGPYSCYGAAMVGGCQSNATSTGGNTDQCYCMSDQVVDGQDPNTLEGLRCPLYGPTFYMNLKIVWILGGEDYMKAMPGSRVPCAGDNNDHCEQTCGQDDITNFSECKGKYYDVTEAPSGAPTELSDSP